METRSAVQLSSTKFIFACAIAACAVAILGRSVVFPNWLIGIELLLTVFSLFIFGSIRYRLDKNALTYGAFLVIAATFGTMWWPTSAVRSEMLLYGAPALWKWVHPYLLTLHGWDQLVHADTMLFILGLTFFVAAISQTQLLNQMAFFILAKTRGRIFPTVALLAAVVSLVSGILDGVSMIGLMIRTLVIVLALAGAEAAIVIYAVIISTITTTVCGMWLAYGEPPNLIMKSNLHPHLPDSFFLQYCLPIAVASYIVVFLNLGRRMRTLQAKNIERPADLSSKPLRKAQQVGLISFLPFMGLLIWHAIDHEVPLFWSSFVGAAVSFIAIHHLPDAVARAWKEALHEYAEYLFLFPLFLAVTFLQKTGFFDLTTSLLNHATEHVGVAHAAYGQFVGATVLSSVLDNNVVADFAGRAIQHFNLNVLHLFAMAQIAGYAVGGCWTHIGSAQSVVAYAFINKNVKTGFTPFEWIKAITPVIAEIFLLASLLIYVAAWVGGHL